MRVSETRVLLLLLFSVQCLCNCPLSPSGSTSCSDTKPPDNVPNTQGAPPSYGLCEFDSSFCNYGQGCRDTTANDWTLLGSFAEVKGTNGFAEHYSVLQSPLLRIDNITCFTFKASVGNPSRLSVYFGEELESSCTVMSEVAPGHRANLSENINLRPATGKIFFRGKSGGNAIGYVRLYSVSLITGRCEDPQCSFDNAYNDRACVHWEWSDWTVVQVTSSVTGSADNVAALGPGLLAATLKTDLLMATGTQSACLQFFYRMTGMNDTLAVSVLHEDGRTELLWQVTNHNESSSWAYATVPLFSDSAFFILFKGQRCHTLESTDIAIDDIKVLRSSSCDYQPQGSKLSSQQLTSTSDPSCDVLPKTTTPSTTTSSARRLPTTTKSAQVRERETSTTSTAIDLPTAKLDDSSLTDNSKPSREAAAAPDIPSATETHYEGLGELSPPSHYTSLVGTDSASHAAASYYNIESTTQAGRHGPHKTPTAETQYESFGEQSPPSVYTLLQNTTAASDTGTYYSNDFAQDNRSYYNVAPGNSAYYNVVTDPHNVKT